MEHDLWRTLTGRAACVWRVKLLCLAVLVPVWTVCYFLPQALPGWMVRVPRQLPLWGIDRAVPFAPWWIFPYMSMYLLLPIPPILATTVGQMRRYVIGMTIMFVTAAVFFFCIPVEYPRPAMPEGAVGFYRLIASVDRPVNSIPSLHAGLTAYALFFGARVLSDLPRKTVRGMLVGGWVWAMVIFYGTLATKQHYFIDLPPGVLLAWVSDRLAWRGAKRDTTQPLPASN